MKYMNLFLLMGLAACGLSPMETPNDKTDDQFYVLEVQPQVIQSLDEEVRITFSKPINVSEIETGSITVTPDAALLSYSKTDEALVEGVENGDLPNHIVEVSEGDTPYQLKIKIDNDSVEEDLRLMILTRMRSSKHYPLNQTLLGSDETYFETLIYEKLNELLPTISQDSTNKPEGSYPDVATEPVIQEQQEEVPVNLFDWNKVLITELSTDPQQDHSDTEGGDGVLFNSIPGSGTISSSDEYVEIFNGTDEILDVSQWSLLMKDGTEEVQTLGDDSWDVYFSVGGTAEALNPGEFAVFGNPTGQMSNTLSVELIDQDGVLIDLVEVEDANASGLEDEAMIRDENGDWIQGSSSLGGF